MTEQERKLEALKLAVTFYKPLVPDNVVEAEGAVLKTAHAFFAFLSEPWVKEVEANLRKP